MGAFANGLILSFEMEVKNQIPNIVLSAGSASFIMSQGDVALGNATIDTFKLDLGTTLLKGVSYFVDPATNFSAGQHFLSEYNKGFSSSPSSSSD